MEMENGTDSEKKKFSQVSFFKSCMGSKSTNFVVFRTSAPTSGVCTGAMTIFCPILMKFVMSIAFGKKKSRGEWGKVRIGERCEVSILRQAISIWVTSASLTSC